MQSRGKKSEKAQINVSTTVMFCEVVGNRLGKKRNEVAQTTQIKNPCANGVRLMISWFYRPRGLNLFEKKRKNNEKNMNHKQLKDPPPPSNSYYIISEFMHVDRKSSIQNSLVPESQ